MNDQTTTGESRSVLNEALPARQPLDGRSPVSDTPIIEIRGLTKRYGTFVAVDNVDLTVYSREIFGILGPNGAGKTTTLEIIEGLRTPDGGSLRVSGIDPSRNPTAVKRLIGVQLQTTALFDYLTVRELIALFAALYDQPGSRAEVDHLIEQVALQEKADSYVDTLSGGQQQRLSIALGLVNDPTILFLDEPTTGLDPQARRNLWDVITSVRESGKTIMLTTHYMEEAEILCDRVAVMDGGRIIACDSPRNLIASLNLPSIIHARLDGAETSDLDVLTSLPEAPRVQFSNGRLEIQTTDVSGTMAYLLGLVSQNGWRLENLSSSGPTLEDVFLFYTGRRLRG